MYHWKSLARVVNLFSFLKITPVAMWKMDGGSQGRKLDEHSRQEMMVCLSVCLFLMVLFIRVFSCVKSWEGR